MNRKTPDEILNTLIQNTPILENCRSSINAAYDIIVKCYELGSKILICGNGGSASDSEHIVGELMKGFILKRPINKKTRNKIISFFPEDGTYLADNLQGALPAISLVSQTSISSAFINDVAPDMVFAQQVFGYGMKNDVLIGLSSSGNSPNVVNAIKVGKSIEIQCIAMTGEKDSFMSSICDITIKAPSQETYRIQEYHLMIYHALCAMIESRFFDE